MKTTSHADNPSFSTEKSPSPFLGVTEARGKRTLIPYFDIKGIEYEPADESGEDSIVIQSYMHIAMIKGTNLETLMRELRQMKVTSFKVPSGEPIKGQPHIRSIEVAHLGSDS